METIADSPVGESRSGRYLFSGELSRETEKAYLVGGVWFPKSQVIIENRDGSTVKISIPEWLRAAKGLSLVQSPPKSVVGGSPTANSPEKFPEIAIKCPEGLDFLPFQKEVIQYIEKTSGKCLVAADMGLGKTLVTIGWLNAHPEIRPVIVVSPASVKLNWEIEYNKWSTNCDKVVQIENGIDAFDSGTVYIVSYDILYRLLSLRDADEKDEELVITDASKCFQKISPAAIVLDECHRIKCNKTKRTKGVRAIVKKHKPQIRIIALTGTPILNKPIEIWNTLQLFDIGVFKNWVEFVKRYCDGKKTRWGWDVGGASNTEELNALLKSTCMIRRTKSEVLPDLPPKRRIIIPINRKGKSSIAEQTKFCFDILSSMDGETTEQIAEVEMLRQKTVAEKLPDAIEFIEDASEQGKVVVFAHHKFVIDELIKKFKNAAVITGETSIADRQREVERFQRDDSCTVFIGSIRAAGEGITLTAASTVVFVEMDWTPGVMRQAEDRCLDGETLVPYRRCVCNNNIGLTQISDIRVGDCVLTHRGKWEKVSGVSSRKHRGMITEIDYVGWFKPLVCTFDHKIFVKRDGANMWIPAHAAIPTDAMVFPKNDDTKRLTDVKVLDKWRVYIDANKRTECAIAGCAGRIEGRGMCRKHYRMLLGAKNRPPKPKQINPRYVRLPDRITIDDEWLYMLGFYVAEGFSSIADGKSKFVSFSAHEKERYILKRIAKKLRSIGINSTIYKCNKSKGIEMRAYSSELARWFRDWFGHGAENKFLPSEVMNLPKEQAEVFMSGYIKGDGYIRKNRVEWVSASRVLCYQMCLMAIRSGFIPTMRMVCATRKDKRTGRSRKTVHWVGAYTMNPVGNKRLMDQDRDYIYRPIRSVKTYYGRKSVYDITVENDHSLVAGFSSVHNCHRIGQKNSVNIYYLVQDGSIEVTMARILQEKQNILDSAIDGAPFDTSKSIFTDVSKAILEKA